MKKNKILIVSDYLFEDNPGGCARVSEGLAKEFSKELNVSLILRGKKENAFKSFKEYSSEIYSCGKNPFLVFKALFEIFKEPPFCLNFHDPYLSFWVILCLKFKKIKIPAFYTYHSPWSEEYKIRAEKNGCLFFHYLGVYIRKKIERFILSYCSNIVCESFYMSKKLKEIHNMDSKVFYLGVDISKFKPISKVEKEKFRIKLNLPLKKKIFFTLRNLEPRMGLENLIKAVKILKDEKEFLFLIAGMGSLRKELVELSKKLKVEDKIIFTGQIKDEVLPIFYAVSDAFVLPTAYLEGFGLISAEAMACGIPVLATPVGANEEVVGSLDKSLIFKDINPAAIAEGIKLFMNREDTDKLSEKAVLTAKNIFSFSAYAEKNLNLIRDLCLKNK
ncbi:MAG: glycosyltransferase family 4 protein [Elusimicrobia bacterium]|nr:glycosyltransferase family 4 protein [Elusimicrobiota bacterium]